MTVEELLSLNQMVTDLKITVRKNGTKLLDELNIGLDAGKKPRFPTKVPISERYIDSMTERREATYIEKSINAWDDGHDYWQVKPNRVPKNWLSLQVFGWETSSAYYGNHPRASRIYEGRLYSNNNFHGTKLHITALPSGEKLTIVEQKPKVEQDLKGQMSFDDLEVVNL